MALASAYRVLMRVVVALGGNALLRRGEKNAATQDENVEIAARAIAALAAEHDVILTHGNGPQVGLLALRSASLDGLPPVPLDVLGAETEGMIGYVLERALRNELPEREVATLLTEVLVDANDPAFAAPTKFVGPVYEETEARELAELRGWTVAADGEFFRRVVPSPEPLQILALPSIRRLVDSGALVICAGGGGIPVAQNGSRRLQGVEAVIDKDLTASSLAMALDADALVMLTDVAAVVRDWGTPDAEPISAVTAAELRAMSFPAGSMGPKIDAACRFVENGGHRAAIGALEEAAGIVAGTSGTQVGR
jgi:carbamate kinase